MKAGWTISAVGHVMVLTWGLVSFIGKPPPPKPPVDFFADVISDAELSQVTQGARSAKPTEPPKPVVETVAEAKPTEDPNVKAVAKPEIVPTAAQPQKPAPEPQKP